MRIGVDYRFLSAGVLTVNRGMGRYTQQQIREAIQIDADNHYVLFCPPRADVTLILPEIRSAPNVSLATVGLSPERLQSNPNKPERVLRFAEEYQSWIYHQHVDLYHATTPFLLNDTIFTQFDACPMVATFYDAIPLVFWEHYLPPATVSTDVYMRAAHFLRSAKRFIAISESARQDAVDYLGYRSDRIDVAYPIADPWFYPMAETAIQSALQGLRQRVFVPDKFLMAVPHLHYSKNFEVLLESYALLPRSLRRALPLIITCHFSTAEKDQVQGLIEKYGLRDEITITGFVSETELAALYNQAVMLVHVSRYEGFGLPVLEAMCCGTPVITSNTSSLPEVGGEAALLVDPNAPRSIADAIQQLYEAPASREAMKQQGLQQARKFSPSQLGQRTVACYHAALQALNEAKPERLRVAMWTPLPPLRTGVADYSVELLENLSTTYAVEVFVDDGYVPDLNVLRRFTVQHFSAFTRRQAQASFDLIIYQLESSAFYRYIYDALQHYPGVVVLHDLAWGYGVSARFTTRHRRLALLDKHHLLQEIVNHSQTLVVHLEAVERDLKTRFAQARVRNVPRGVADPLLDLHTLNPSLIRIELGLPPEAFVVGVFGMVDSTKRLDVVFKAFQALLHEHPNSFLVIVGDTPVANYKHQLAGLARRLKIFDRVVCTGHLALSKAEESRLFDQWLAACDVVVSLRYPSRQQMSGSLARAIAAGNPVIITDLPEWDFIPSDFCWRVAPDAQEVETLADYLRQLASDEALRSQAAHQARAYFEREANLFSLAAGYRAVIEQVTGRASSVSASANAIEESPMLAWPLNKICDVNDWSAPAVTQALREIVSSKTSTYLADRWTMPGPRHYWESAMLFRGLQSGQALRSDARLLGIGEATDLLVRYLTNHVEQVFVFDSHDEATPITPEHCAPPGADLTRLIIQPMNPGRLNFPDNYFDGVFICGLTWRPGDLSVLAQRVYEIGRVLKPGGVLSLTLNFRLNGPPGKAGWDARRPLVAWPEIQKYVIEASGLELAEPVALELSTRTLTHYRAPTIRATESESSLFRSQIIQVVEGFVFCPLHLALIKRPSYPATSNQWASPSPEVKTSIEHTSLALGQTTFRVALIEQRRKKAFDIETWAHRPEPEAPVVSTPASDAGPLNVMRRFLTEERLLKLRWHYGNALRRMPNWAAQALHQLALRLGFVETSNP